MGKYDFALDFSTPNALSWIVKKLQPGTRILELGPANGRLTRYLAKEMHCTVDIVEIDAEAGKEAAEFANIACLGPIEGDIESEHWLERLSGNEYDYIVCADIIEHLRNPGKVLSDCMGFLKKGGSVLVSVPNIAHNAVIIGLIQGKFEYNNIGLLDNTHIHFFTRQSFRNLVAPIGYAVAREAALHVPVPNTELGVDYGQIDRSVARVLRSRDDGIVYQCLFELKRREDMHDCQETVRIESWPHYNCECFPIEKGEQNFTEEKHCICNVWPKMNGRLKFDFDLRAFKSILRLRIDPLNVNCLLRFVNMELVYEDGARRVDSFWLSGIRSGDLLIFEDDDPQIIIEIGDQSGLQGVRGEFDVLFYDDGQIHLVEDLAIQAGRVPAMDSCINEQKRYIADLENSINDQKVHIANLENCINAWKLDPPLGRKQLIKLFVKKCIGKK